MECPDCGGNGSSWLWARTNGEAKHLLESLDGTIEMISMDHDLGGEHLDPDDPQTFYFRGSIEDDGKRLAEWMVETGNVPDHIEIHSWNPDGVDRILGVFTHASKYHKLPRHHWLTIKKAEAPA